MSASGNQVEDVYTALPVLNVLMVFLVGNFGVSAVSEEGPKAWQGACEAAGSRRVERGILL